MDKYDAELFRTLCGFAWTFGRKLTPLIFDTRKDIYINNGLDFSGLTHLDAIGLIQFEGLSGFANTGVPDKVMIFYYGQPLLLERQAGVAKDTLNIGHILLTNAARQLAEICGSSPVPGFYEYVVEVYRGEQYLPPLPPSS